MTQQNQFKQMKIRVYSPEHGKQISEALLLMGYHWKFRICDMMGIIYSIHAHTDGHLGYTSVEERDVDHFFERQFEPEYQLYTTPKGDTFIPVEEVNTTTQYMEESVDHVSVEQQGWAIPDKLTYSATQLVSTWSTKKVTEYNLTPQDVVNLLASALNVQPDQILLLDDIDNLDFKVLG